MKILWTNRARLDHAEIFETIAEDNPIAAERVYKEIEERTQLLVQNPRLGVRRSEISAGLRMLSRGVYLIFYRTLPDSDDDVIDEVEILRVVHGKRDMARVFNE